MAGIRRFIEHRSRGKSFWRRLPPPFSAARIRVTPDAQLSVLRVGSGWVTHYQELLSIAERHALTGNTVWDIGAHLGVFAAACALRCGPTGSVLCVEPDIVLSQLIRRTAERMSRDAAPITVLPAAVSKDRGAASFQIAERGRASNSLARYGGRSQMGGVRECQPVALVTLDDLLQISPAPQLLKIDVEGAEGEIFLGARELLTQVRPIIYVDVEPKHFDAVTEQLHAASYELFDSKKEKVKKQPLEHCIWLALPVRQC